MYQRLAYVFLGWNSNMARILSKYFDRGIIYSVRTSASNSPSPCPPFLNMAQKANLYIALASFKVPGI